MNAPTGRHEDGPIDAPVRHLLWRLRARLVTPPSEQRVKDDLDRLFAAAQEQAHDAPSSGASSRPEVHDRGVTAPDHPVPAAVSGETDDASSVSDLSRARRRRLGPTRVMGRVAAGLVVLTVATGVAGARDGVEMLRAFLSPADTADTTEPVEPLESDADLAIDGTSATEGASDEPNGGQVPLDSASEVDEAPQDGTGGDGAEEDVDGSQDPEGENAQPGSAQPDEGSEGSNSGTSGSGSSTEDSVEEPAGGADDSDGVVAAPEDGVEEPAVPNDLEGAGGQVTCDEPDLVDCLDPDDEADDGTPKSEADAEDEDDPDALARRRFGGNDD